MPLNNFFGNWDSSGEQQLIEDLIIESIRIYGIEVYYLPRTLTDYDEIYGEDSASLYSSAHLIEMYIRNVQGFGGDGDFLSKFGIEIRDEVTLTVARRVFNDEVGSEARIDRPQEGDLIWFPLNRKIFRVRFVEHEAIMYQLGALQTYELTCELHEYSGERLRTGVAVIDEIEKLRTTDMVAFAILTQDGKVIVDQDGYPIVQSGYDMEDQLGELSVDNDEVQEEADAVIDFDETDPFSQNGRY